MISDESLVVIQHNLEDGGLSRPEPGTLWDRSRLDGFIGFIRQQIAQHGANVVLQQEGCFYHADGHALLHEIEAAVGLRGFIAPGLRAESEGAKSHPTVVWIDPQVITPVRHIAHSGGMWWHSAMEVQCTAYGRALTLVSAHLNVASPVLREGEGAALTMTLKNGGFILGVDGNSARATGPAQSMDMGDRVHHAHRCASPDRPQEADRAVARFLENAGLVEVHTRYGTSEATRWTTGHRAKHGQRQGGGSHADHGYLSPDLADGEAGEITECVVITEAEYPGIEDLSDHLPSRFTVALRRAAPTPAG